MKKLPLLFIMLSLACTKNEQNDNNTTPEKPGETTPTIINCDIHGYAQKGQFAKGSPVTAFAVDSSVVATGESFPSNISDNSGAFSITGKTTAPYMDLRAEGYYFNELTGTLSNDRLYLEAFVQTKDNKANINLMTTAIRLRVKKLIKNGASFDNASTQAQKELISALGFTSNAVSFYDMDITGVRDADGMLLAFSCVLQNCSSTSEVTTFIQEIASDLEDDGKLTAEVLGKFKSRQNGIDPFRVFENMSMYYTEKGLSITTVPIFYKYLGGEYDKEFILTPGKTEQPFEIWSPRLGDEFDDIKSGEIVSSVSILSKVDFTVESDVEGVSLEKTCILGPAYRVSVTIPANSSFEGRYVHIIFKDKTGKELDRQEYKQGRDLQYLLIGRSVESFTEPEYSDNLLAEGSIVSINGEEHKIQKLPYKNQLIRSGLGAIVHKAKYYTVSYPSNAVEIKEENGTYVAGTPLFSVKVTNNPVSNSSHYTMNYFAVCDLRASSITLPPSAPLFPVFSQVFIDLLNYDSTSWDYLVVEALADDEYLAGTATYMSYTKCNIEYKDYLYDSISEAQLSFAEDKSKTIRLNKPEANSTCVIFQTFPQKLTKGFKAILYNKGGTKITEETFDAVSLKSGEYTFYQYYYIMH